MAKLIGSTRSENFDENLFISNEYSWFYYIASDCAELEQLIVKMAEQYCEGCKLYAVFGDDAQLALAACAIDTALTKRALVRDRDNLVMDFEGNAAHSPAIEDRARAFTAFDCSFSVLSSPVSELPTFNIPSGKMTNEQHAWLESLSEKSQFNLEQYLVEHAKSEKNIIIRAGAGTGKTYTMISRIGYICYDQNISLQNMADRIVMITFTNEAADQMKERLKSYFRNRYLLSFRVEYLTMISRIEHMQISTIHSYAKHLIARLGAEFGYGTELTITSSQFVRRRKASDILDTYVDQKKLERGNAYLGQLGMPAYALRDSIIDFIDKLHSKNVDVASMSAKNFGRFAPDSQQAVYETRTNFDPR
ncbi:hypothetical protein AGMMS50276_11150 [Synergistales bacterium]|nr:hypothetical protein AGMMS50276_11150 [Synergistales bacterium]